MISIETNSPLSKLFHPVIVIKTYIQNVSYLVDMMNLSHDKRLTSQVI